MRHVRHRSRAQDQRGAVAVMVGLLVALVLAITSLVVDIGMQRVMRRDLQAVADVAALDASRHLDGRTGAQVRTAVADEVQQALTRNGDSLGEPPTLSFELGEMTVTGTFRPVLDSAVPTAVRVTAASSVGYVVADGDGLASRSAVAASTSSACYQVGSYAALVRTGRSPLLNPVLRRIGQSNATLAALDYTGLAAVAVNLDRLAAELGVGTLNQLARTTVSAKSYYLAVLNALPAGTSGTTVTALNALRTWVNANVTLDVGRILGVATGSGAVLGARYNALDLVAGSMLLINGQNTLNLYTGALLPGLANTNIALKLIQGPRQFCGRPGEPNSTARPGDTEQLGVHVDTSLNPSNVVVGLASVPGIVSAPVNLTVHQPNHLGLDLSLAPTQTTLKRIVCGDPASATFEVRNGLATVKFQTPIRTSLRVKVKLLGMVSLAEVQVDVNATVNVTATISPSGNADYTITVPPRQFDTAYPTTTGGITAAPPTVNAGASVVAHLGLLNGTLGAWVGLSTAEASAFLDASVKGAVNALLDPGNPTSLSNGLINPLLALAGTEVAGARLSLDSAPAMRCGVPALRG
ncbi:hypothetical protein INN71_13780 [Nocardioides sp. ChNu-153]|uniref:pilus assembly protein TadG-related protein n=1 Tax=unclassified Nocardioides TaxID=2615069 RepID=UPI002406E9AE|nr:MULTISPECIES: pilus assembly protein TadG-related protein [unclassified Nocardioides]MDF9714946.1 hypothetical protein [Nocardioides sp. ChNu-99]MDN7122457.1 hypothetical protein [Nocardioides sp. ChNu-153]